MDPGEGNTKGRKLVNQCVLSGCCTHAAIYSIYIRYQSVYTRYYRL